MNGIQIIQLWFFSEVFEGGKYSIFDPPDAIFALVWTPWDVKQRAARIDRHLIRQHTPESFFRSFWEHLISQLLKWHTKRGYCRLENRGGEQCHNGTRDHSQGSSKPFTQQSEPEALKLSRSRPEWSMCSVSYWNKSMWLASSSW